MPDVIIDDNSTKIKDAINEIKQRVEILEDDIRELEDRKYGLNTALEILASKL